MVTVGTHLNADCVLKNPSSKLHKYVVDKKIKHSYDIRFRVFCFYVRLIFNKICYGITQSKILKTKISIFMKETLINKSAEVC